MLQTKPQQNTFLGSTLTTLRELSPETQPIYLPSPQHPQEGNILEAFREFGSGSETRTAHGRNLLEEPESLKDEI